MKPQQFSVTNPNLLHPQLVWNPLRQHLWSDREVPLCQCQDLHFVAIYVDITNVFTIFIRIQQPILHWNLRFLISDNEVVNNHLDKWKFMRTLMDIYINPTQCCVGRQQLIIICSAHWYRFCDKIVLFHSLSSIYDIKDHSVRRSMYVYFLAPRVLYTLHVRGDGDLFSRESSFTFFVEIVICDCSVCKVFFSVPYIE